MLAVLKSSKVWLLLLIIAGYIFLPKLLPPRFEQKISWHPDERNWFGQTGWTFVYAYGLLIYCARPKTRFFLDSYIDFALEALTK